MSVKGTISLVSFPSSKRPVTSQVDSQRQRGGGGGGEIRLSPIPFYEATRSIATPPGWETSPLHGYPSPNFMFIGTHLHAWVKRNTIEQRFLFKNTARWCSGQRGGLSTWTSVAWWPRPGLCRCVVFLTQETLLHVVLLHHLCPRLNSSAKFTILRDSRNFRSFDKGLPFAFLRWFSSTALQNFAIFVIFAVSSRAFHKPDFIFFSEFFLIFVVSLSFFFSRMTVFFGSDFNCGHLHSTQAHKWLPAT